MTQKRRISVVVACYNEAENIGPMHQRLSAALQSLDRYDYEILFVDNDSIDDSARLLTALAEKDSRVKVLFMSRNFGSPQPSFLAGLAHCRGHAAVLLHGDIQDPPEMIPQFVEKWEAGYEVVYGVSRRRDGFGPITNLVFRGFYALLARMAYISIPLNAGEFSLIGRRAIDELLKIDEYDYYIRCLRAYVGFKQTGIEYERSARSRGRSTQKSAHAPLVGEDAHRQFLVQAARVDRAAGDGRRGGRARVDHRLPDLVRDPSRFAARHPDPVSCSSFSWAVSSCSR